MSEDLGSNPSGAIFLNVKEAYKMWKRLDKIKPKKNGKYLVCWSEPYHKEMSISIGYFHNDGFTHQFAGANEVLFWKELPILPKISIKIRTRRCENC